MMTLTLREVADILDLPTAEDVADLIRAAGVRAVKASPYISCSCPVAQFAEGLVGEPVSVSSATMFLASQPIPGVQPPLAAADFINRYDKHDRAFDDLRPV